jgi:hypothetical protein
LSGTESPFLPLFDPAAVAAGPPPGRLRPDSGGGAAVGIPLVRCPECHVGLKAKSPDGFPAGQLLTCPKCQTMFAAEAPPPVEAKPAPRKAAPVVEDDEDGDRPKKKRPRVDEDDEDDRPKKKRPRSDDGDEKDRPRKRRRDEDDEADDRPKKKRKPPADDEDRGGFQYTKSPIRIIVIAVLLIILAVLSVLLYQKWQREKADEKSAAPTPAPTARHI